MNIMASDAVRQTPLRGLFVNTAKEQCSIHESGNMVLSSLLSDSAIKIDYLEIKRHDYHNLDAQDFLKKISADYGAEIDASSYDFTVVNYHHFTMAPFLGKRQLDGLPGRKYAIVLEVEPHDCLSFCPYGWFDGYIVLDPSVRDNRPEVFAFPRPIEQMLPGNLDRLDEIPVIGSFGFGTPGKGFELVVDAVNREFDRALVRVNIPSNIYADDAMASVHGENYARYLARICRDIAKPGIDVQFTYDFLSKDELMEWCSQNTLNCFMYTRKQSGLAATTDQAVASGRPLLVSGNQTFRHIHEYMRPYPGTTLRQAIETSGPIVKTIQKDWSPQSFRSQFLKMVELTDRQVGGDAVHVVSRRGDAQRFNAKPTMLLISPTSIQRDAIDTLSARAVSALSDASGFQVIKSTTQTSEGYARTCFWLRPHVACFIGLTTDRAKLEIARFRHAYPECKTILITPADVERVEGAVQPLDTLGADIRYVLPGIAPFNTQLVAKQQGPVRVGLYGYDGELEAGELSALFSKIDREIGAAHVFLYLIPTYDARKQREVSDRLRMLRRQIGGSVTIEVKPLPFSAAERIQSLAMNGLNIIRYGSSDGDVLSDMRDLALTTERPLVFTRLGPFPGQPNGGSFIEDQRLPYFMEAGNGAHIALFNALAEGRFVAEIEDIARDLIPKDKQTQSISLRRSVNREGWVLKDANPSFLVDLPDDAPREKSTTEAPESEAPVEQAMLYDAIRIAIGEQRDPRVVVLGSQALHAADNLRKDGVILEKDGLSDTVFVSDIVNGAVDLKLRLSQIAERLSPNGTAFLLCYHAEKYQTSYLEDSTDFKAVTPEQFDEVLKENTQLICELRPDITSRPPCIYPSAFTPPPVGLYVIKKREGV
ncbi:hypothetical protein [Rhizobium sp. SL86]|uniref:hypothetical protein n=1 Tax=Rhizobium sp. SL86 TaxID=2995148 RepID=UPI0022730831|nr:hypothetical protein [Rhizobium sp. SL86]MCY1669392.1 hypothetical protein [Rhizobium sp. SL86]